MTVHSPSTETRVDHVGIAVPDVAAGEQVFELLGATLLSRGLGPRDAFRYHYYEIGDASRLELIEPVADDSFLVDFLDQYGSGVHHVTLEVGDLEAMSAHLRDHDIRVVDYAELGEFCTAFVSPTDANGVLYQLVEYYESFDDPINGCALSEVHSHE